MLLVCLPFPNRSRIVSEEFHSFLQGQKRRADLSCCSDVLGHEDKVAFVFEGATLGVREVICQKLSKSTGFCGCLTRVLLHAPEIRVRKLGIQPSLKYCMGSFYSLIWKMPCKLESSLSG